MSAVQNQSESVKELLEQMHSLMERLRGEYIHGIKTPADYDRACALLDELTDGQVRTSVEEKILIDLEEAILAYERDSEQFKEFHATVGAPLSPVERLKSLMEMNELTNSDLPEIGDSTIVSKVLNGHRVISHKMAYALSERFSMKPDSFLDKSAAPKAHVSTGMPRKKGAGGLMRELVKKAARQAIGASAASDLRPAKASKPAPKRRDSA